MDDDVCVLLGISYNDNQTVARCKDYFRQLCRENKIAGAWGDTVWNLFDGVNRYRVLYDVDNTSYMEHGWKYIGIPHEKLIDALRLYAVCCMGEVVFRKICSRISTIKKVLENVGGKDLEIAETDKCAIEDFLHFVGVPDPVIEAMMGRIMFKSHRHNYMRKLKPMVTYLAAADKAKEIMRYGSREEKIKCFPIYLVTNLGPKIPLRATEWTLLPFRCVERNSSGDYSFTIRRTMLKGGGRQVAYDVENDYQLFTYKVPDIEEMRMIEWYMRETGQHFRKYLFDFDEMNMRDAVRGRLCTASMNERISCFFEEYLRQDGSLSWAMGICGGKKLTPFTLGDMRPLALVNLYYSGASLDVCMELANHENMDITYHYICNIKDLVETSAVMEVQKKLNSEKHEIELLQQRPYRPIAGLKNGCNSKKLMYNPMDLSDCDEKCIASGSCIGCMHYNATKEEIAGYVQEKETGLDYMVTELKNHIKNLNDGNTMDKILLQLQKASEAYGEALKLKIESECKKWKEAKEGYFV